MSTNLSHILNEISSLELKEKLRLIELIVHNINTTSNQQNLDWNNLYGLGKDIWAGEDAQDYVNSIREDR